MCILFSISISSTEKLMGTSFIIMFNFVHFHGHFRKSMGNLLGAQSLHSCCIIEQSVII